MLNEYGVSGPELFASQKIQNSKLEPFGQLFISYLPLRSLLYYITRSSVWDSLRSCDRPNGLSAILIHSNMVNDRYALVVVEHDDQGSQGYSVF